jgi:hypothetical protein
MHTQEEKKELDRLHAIMNTTEHDQFDDIVMNVTRDANGRIKTIDGISSDDSLLHVVFEVESVHNKPASYDAGHAVYTDVHYINIMPPGATSRNLKVRAPVDAYYAWRFAHDFGRFKDGRENTMTGTALSLLSGMAPSMVKEFERLHIYTVEQLAGAPDSAGSIMRSFAQWKNKAAAYLSDQSKSTSTQALQAQLAKRDQQLEALLERVSQLESNQGAADVDDDAAAVDAEADEAPVLTPRKKSYSKK